MGVPIAHSRKSVSSTWLHRGGSWGNGPLFLAALDDDDDQHLESTRSHYKIRKCDASLARPPIGDTVAILGFFEIPYDVF